MIEPDERSAWTTTGPRRAPGSATTPVHEYYLRAVLWAKTEGEGRAWVVGALEDERVCDGAFSVIRFYGWPRLLKRLGVREQVEIEERVAA